MMKMVKAKIGVLALCSALMLPAAASAASTDSTTTTTTSTTDGPVVVSSIIQTNVNGVMVPGIYVVNSESRVAFIPGGVGLVVVNNGIALPIGAYYVNP